MEPYFYFMEEMNFMVIEAESKPVIASYYAPEIDIVPRNERDPYDLPPAKKPKKVWKFNKSIFRTFKRDSDVNYSPSLTARNSWESA